MRRAVRSMPASLCWLRRGSKKISLKRTRYQIDASLRPGYSSAWNLCLVCAVYPTLDVLSRSLVSVICRVLPGTAGPRVADQGGDIVAAAEIPNHHDPIGARWRG